MDLQNKIHTYNAHLAHLNTLLSIKDEAFEVESKTWGLFQATYSAFRPNSAFEASFETVSGASIGGVQYAAEEIASFDKFINEIKTNVVLLPEIDYNGGVENVELAEKLHPLYTKEYEYKKLSQIFSEYPTKIQQAQTLDARAKKMGIRPQVTYSDNENDQQRRALKDKFYKKLKPLRIITILFCILLPIILTAAVGLPLYYAEHPVWLFLILAASAVGSFLLKRLIFNGIWSKAWNLARKEHNSLLIKRFEEGLPQLNPDHINGVLEILSCLSNLFTVMHAIYDDVDIKNAYNVQYLELYKLLIIQGYADTTKEAEIVSDKLLEEAQRNAEIQRQWDAYQKQQQEQKARQDAAKAFLRSVGALGNIRKDLEELKELEEKKIKMIEDIPNVLHHY